MKMHSKEKMPAKGGKKEMAKPMSKPLSKAEAAKRDMKSTKK